MADDDFGAKDISLRDEEDEFESKDIDLGDEDFGEKDIPEQDQSWGRSILRKGRGLIAGLGGLPGDIEELWRTSPKVSGMATLHPSFREEGKNFFPGEELEDKDRYLYNTEDIKNKADEVAKEYGYDLKPHNFLERVEDKALEFAGTGGLFGAITKGAKGLKAAASLPELLSSLGMAVASQSGEELELPELIKLGATVYAGHKGRKLSPGSVKEAIDGTKNIANNVKEFVKAPKKAIKEGAAKAVSKLGPYKQEVAEAAERRGVKPTLSNVIESRPIQATETYLKESALSGEAYEKKLSSINQQTKDSFERILNGVSQDIRPGRDIAEDTIVRLKKNIEESKDVYTKLYQESNKAIKKGETVPYSNITKNMREVRKTLSQTALNKGQRAESLKVIDEISNNLRKEAEANFVKNRLDQIVDAQGKKAKPTPNQRKQIEKEAREAVRNGKGEVSPQILLGTEDALNDYIDWHSQGGVKKTLKHVLGGVKSDIEVFGQGNKAFQDLYKMADKEFASHAKRLRSDLVKSILKKEVPEEVLSKMNNVSNIKRVESAVAQNPEGRKLFNGLKRAKLQELLEGKFVDNAGNVKHGTFATALKDPKKQGLYEELLGKQNYRRLKDMEKVSGDMANLTAKFANTSKTATKALDYGLVASFLSQVYFAFKTGGLGNIALTAGKLGIQASIMPVLSKLLTDDEFIKLVSKAAQNVKSPQAFKVYNDKVIDLVAKTIRDYAQDQSKEQQQK
jgi:hypothetical protein